MFGVCEDFENDGCDLRPFCRLPARGSRMFPAIVARGVSMCHKVFAVLVPFPFLLSHRIDFLALRTTFETFGDEKG